MHPSPPISGPLTFGTLIERTFRLYGAHFWRFLLIASVLMVPLGVLNGLITGSLTAKFVELGRTASTTSANIPELVQMMMPRIVPYTGLFCIFGIASIVAASLTSLGLTVAGIDGVNEREAGLDSTLRQAAGRILPLWGMMLIEGLVMLPLLLPGVVVAGLLGFGVAALASNRDDVGAGFFALTCVLACGLLPLVFLALFYLSARWAVAMPGLVEQRWGPIEALRASWRLTQGQVLRVMGYLVALFLMGFFFISIVTGGFQLVFQILMMAAPRLMSTLSGTSSAIVQALWAPVNAVAIVLLYYDLRWRAGELEPAPPAAPGPMAPPDWAPPPPDLPGT